LRLDEHREVSRQGVPVALDQRIQISEPSLEAGIISGKAF
jgi:hypothetical protein